MRLLHPTTIKILAERKDVPKTHLAHAWSEIYKFLSQSKTHPKIFFKDNREYGNYLAYIYNSCADKGYNLDQTKINNLKNAEEILAGWSLYALFGKNIIDKYFDDNYLFSDAVSLYYKGTNIFPDIFGDDWRKYVPVESRKEIIRQCEKNL